MGFAGAVWTEVPHLEVLCPVLPLFYHAGNIDIPTIAARYLGAAKKAILALEHYYKHEFGTVKTLDPHIRPSLHFPYPNQYSSLSDSTTHTFEYITSLKADKLIFRGKEDNDDVFIKFVHRYSEDAHLKCSELGFAPALRGFKPVPGGWYMVVMDDIDATYQELDDAYRGQDDLRTKASLEEVQQHLTKLHQAGYVHGDIRTTNIMVKKDGNPGIMLIDFDWAGEIGKVRYPTNVNTVDVTRPAGAYDKQLILAEHDMEMVAIMSKVLLSP